MLYVLWNLWLCGKRLTFLYGPTYQGYGVKLLLVVTYVNGIMFVQVDMWGSRDITVPR